jgi:mannose-6-phosphate isomerase-like protein (cupin superfamily)
MSGPEKSEALSDERPWGRWEMLAQGPGYKVKRITVLPDRRLSYQKHSKRREIWTVAMGRGKVTLDGSSVEIGPGGTIDIPVGGAHRVANEGIHSLVLIEVQLGPYLGEDDILRLEDDYGRVK